MADKKEQATLVRQAVNILEDERIERAISMFYWGVAPVIRRVGDFLYAGQKRVCHGRPTIQALACCLAWR